MYYIKDMAHIGEHTMESTSIELQTSSDEDVSLLPQNDVDITPVRAFDSFSVTPTLTIGSIDQTPEYEDVLKIVVHHNLTYVYFAIAAIGMIGNATVIGVMITSKAMRRRFTNIFIINQSMIDFWGGFFLIMLNYFRDEKVFDNLILRDLFCKLWLTNFVQWSLFISSTVNLVVLTIDRYVALVHPLYHKQKCTRQSVYVLLAFAWLFGIAWNLAYILPTTYLTPRGVCILHTHPLLSVRQAIGYISIILHWVIPLTIIIFCYTRIFMVINQSGSLSMLRTTTGGGSDGVNNKGPDKQLPIADPKRYKVELAKRNTLKTLLIVCVMFVLCWTFNQILYFLLNLGFKIDMTSEMYHASVALVFCNLMVNPIIYLFKYDQYRSRLAHLVRRLSTTCRQPLGDDVISGEASVSHSVVTSSDDIYNI